MLCLYFLCLSQVGFYLTIFIVMMHEIYKDVSYVNNVIVTLILFC